MKKEERVSQTILRREDSLKVEEEKEKLVHPVQAEAPAGAKAAVVEAPAEVLAAEAPAEATRVLVLVLKQKITMRELGLQPKRRHHILQQCSLVLTITPTGMVKLLTNHLPVTII